MKPLNSVIIIVGILALTFGIILANSDHKQNQNQDSDQGQKQGNDQNHNKNNDQQSNDSKTSDLVQLGLSKVSSQGRHVGVHVPPFFEMEMDTRGPGEGTPNLEESILGGLIKVNVNRKRDENGRLSGPIRVSLFGRPVYDNHQPDPQSVCD